MWQRVRWFGWTPVTLTSIIMLDSVKPFINATDERTQRRANFRRRQKNNSPAIPKLRTGNVQPSVAELLQIGLKNQQAGRLNEAEFYYRAVLTAQPDRRVLGAFRRRISAYTSNLCMGSSPGGTICANDDPILKFNGTDFCRSRRWEE